MLKILILSCSAWREDNSFGSTYSNIFEGMEGIEIANIYCKAGSPENNIVIKYYQITEKTIIKNLKNSSFPTGREICIEGKGAVGLLSSEQKIFDSVRKMRWIIIFWLRDLIWKVGRWESKQIMDFIDRFNPDLIFYPVYYSNYMSDIVMFIKEYSSVPMVSYISDDNYTLRQFSLSPLYWIDRLIKRRKIRKVITSSEMLYVVSDIQKKEYEKYFPIKCDILTKMHSFEKELKLSSYTGYPLEILYTGNLGNKRWKVLSFIAMALKEINMSKKKAVLKIYTLTPLTRKMNKKLNIKGSSEIMGSVSAEEVTLLQRKADILVHVESFHLKERLSIRQSFSTKLVDYLSIPKCIFAVGPNDVASIDYLKRNDAAIIAQSKGEVKDKLNKIIDNKEILSKYSLKAWEAGKRNHQKKANQAKLYENLSRIVKDDRRDKKIIKTLLI